MVSKSAILHCVLQNYFENSCTPHGLHIVIIQLIFVSLYSVSRCDVVYLRVLYGLCGCCGWQFVVVVYGWWYIILGV